VESAEETGEIERDEKELIHSVFEFSDTIAREIMTPRVDLDALSVTADAITAVKMIETTGHSRIPLFEETDDQIVGIVHAKDLLMAIAAGKKVTLRGIMRQPLFVPENKNLHELLGEMRNSRSQFAIVQDEFGGTAGIVTIEDIVEELVGDIVDEYDNEEPSFQKVDDGWLVDGKTHWNDVNHEIGSEFDSEEFDTIGGYVFGLFGRQPVLAETIEEAEHRFTVTKTDGRRILQLRIEKVSEDRSSELEQTASGQSE
jgi:CBS domain containing-hemolysin-like protein